MSRKRFTTMIAVVLLLGAAGLLSLYMTLGRMNATLRSQGHAPAADGAAPEGGEKIQEMTLTPAGQSQLRAEQARAQQERAQQERAQQEHAQKAQPAAAPAPPPPPASSPAKPAAAPSGASGSHGR